MSEEISAADHDPNPEATDLHRTLWAMVGDYSAAWVKHNAGEDMYWWIATRFLWSDWLRRHDAKVSAKALEAFADTLGVNVGDEDDDYWRGYRNGQRQALRSTVETAARIRREAGIV